MGKKDGGAAFPYDRRLLPGQSQTGMTQRQWYAGLSLAVAAERSRTEAFETARDVARFCFELADAMIAEGSK